MIDTRTTVDSRAKEIAQKIQADALKLHKYKIEIELRKFIRAPE